MKGMERGPFVDDIMDQYVKEFTKMWKEFDISKQVLVMGIGNHEETIQRKCTGVLSFDADGNIKNCPFFHYAKYNVTDSNIKESVNRMISDWLSYEYAGECPLYSDPIGFKNHLEKMGWKHISNSDEEYLNNNALAQQLMGNYRDFLEIKEAKELS